ncbi:MAG: squalene synthase HpnC [Acidimicrobiales bacterium]
MNAIALDRLPGEQAVLGKAASENFPVAMRLLAARERESLLAIYAYARLVDDVGDELEGTTSERLAALDLVEAELDRAFAGTAAHPVFCRLGVAIASCGLDRGPLADLIEANRQDQSVTRYETFDQLLGYCRLSANPVGRLVLAVFGQGGGERDELSDMICTGLQLVEHFQDVAEDAERGRVYLPGEDLDRFSVPRAFLSGGATIGLVPASFRRLMAFEVGRARSMLAGGSDLVNQMTAPRAALAIAGFAGGGLAQLAAIEHAGYDVLRTEVKASHMAVASEALSLLARRRTRRGDRRRPRRTT